MKELELSTSEISILLLDDRGIARLNGQYRGKPRPTDVLSFPLYDPAELPAKPEILGDIAISVETAWRQAGDRGMTLDEELAFLLVHGTLHLIGYDHERSPADSRRMMYRQKKILGRVLAQAT